MVFSKQEEQSSIHKIGGIRSHVWVWMEAMISRINRTFAFVNRFPAPSNKLVVPGGGVGQLQNHKQGKCEAGGHVRAWRVVRD